MDESVNVGVETITPQMAAEWLTHNTVNRPLRKNRVTSYADQMRRGQWHLTGEPIQMNGSSLLNGQHRLTACIEAGVPFETVVVRGVQADAMTVMDTGLPRSVGDMLRFAGLSSTTTIGAASRTILAFHAGIVGDSRRISTRISRDDIAQFALQNNDILQRSVLRGRHIGEAIGLPRSTWAAFYFLIVEADAEAADVFTDLVISGEGLQQGSPIYALRSWVISSVIQKRQRSNIEQIGVAIKAWNAWLSGVDNMKLLKFLPTEDLPSISRP